MEVLCVPARWQNRTGPVQTRFGLGPAVREPVRRWYRPGDHRHDRGYRMDVAVFLLTLGLAAAVPGGWVALNVRGAAASLERWSDSNAELRMHARGDLGPVERRMSARLFRLFGTVIGLCGCVLVLGGLLELLG